MAEDPSVVTVSGPDRGALLTDLTLRFGRIDVVGEREVVLPGGARGVEVTVRHQPFTDALTDVEQLEEEALAAEHPEAAPPPDDATAPPPEPALAEPAGRAEADQLLVEAHAEADRLLAEAQQQAAAIVAEAHEEAASLRTAAEAEHVAAEAQREEEHRRATAEVRRRAEAEGERILEQARAEGRALQAQREKELADARAEGRAHVRDARDHAEALLREARAQSELSAIEGRALAEAVRDAQHQVRTLGGQLTQRLQDANKDLLERTSLHGVQARLRAQGATPTAVEIAEHLAELVDDERRRGAERRAPEPGQEPPPAP
jgi:hypothetical protein